MKGAAVSGVPAGVWEMEDEVVDIFRDMSILALTSPNGPLASVGDVGCMLKLISALALKSLRVMGEQAGSEVGVNLSKAQQTLETEYMILESKRLQNPGGVLDELNMINLE